MMHPFIALAVSLGLFANVGTPAVTASAANAANEVVAKIQKFYDATKELSASFEQTIESGVGGRPKKAAGEVFLKKPGKMRWDYVKPEKKLMVADGKTLWVYEEEDAQAFKQSMTSSTLPAQVSFLVGEGKLADEFDATITKVEGVGGPDDVVLKMVPKAATTAYRYLLFVADPKTGQVKETVIYDQQGGTNRLKFANVKINSGVDDAKFRFTPPAGTKIVTPPR
jgi:outer membrane lipoprotein carrier protein